jgi:hypothetical protein
MFRSLLRMAFPLRFVTEKYRLGREVGRRDRRSPRLSNGLRNCRRLDTQVKNPTWQSPATFSRIDPSCALKRILRFGSRSHLAALKNCCRERSV